MKKLVANTNPFMLSVLLIPVLFALIMGVSYQFQQKEKVIEVGTTTHATSLFYKSVSLIKTVCSVAKQNVW